MQVQDLFKRLSYGELSALTIGMEGAGSIADDRQEQVISHITTALTALYARFPHRKGFLTLETVEGQQVYVLNQGAPFIIETDGKVFDDDIIKIVAVDRLDDPATDRIDENGFLGINRRNAVKSAQLTAFNIIRFNTPVKTGERYLIEYQAKHPPLSLPVELSEEIKIMPALEEALQVRVAAGIFSGMVGETHNAKGLELMARYEALCALSESEDMAQETSTDETDRLRDKGFV